MSSYPTYEEWKQNTLRKLKESLGLVLSSYPTYEEWKHLFIKLSAVFS